MWNFGNCKNTFVNRNMENHPGKQCIHKCHMALTLAINQVNLVLYNLT